MKNRVWLLWLLALLAIIGVFFFLFRAKPLIVETAEVRRGPLKVQTEEEGKTRIHDHFVLAASVGGKTRRIELHAGDTVHAGDVVAWIDPSPIDPRQSAVLEAHLRAALAAQKQASAMLAKATSDFEQAQRDRNRSKLLWEQGIISKEAYERVLTSDRSAAEQLEQARANLEAASFQAEEAKASLLVFRGDGSDLPTAIRTPVAGRVLRLIEQSERIVAAGTPLIEIGYAPRLEIVSDFLTREAARMEPGMPALITDWGGEEALGAHVRTIEPGGFTKVSALGVEEQRVNVILDFDQAPPALQDGFHCQVSVITWQSQDVLLIPSSAVFRKDADWAAFVVDKNVAKLAKLKIGHKGEDLWEVLEGVPSAAYVIVHPAAEVTDGSSVRSRTSR